MHRIRHWTASLCSRVDWMVSQVENHEALAESAIRDLQRHAARARVRMGRMRADGRRLADARRAEAEAASTWRERARRLAGDDEARALECLRRARAAAEREASLAERCAEHDRLEQRLARDLGLVDERLAALRVKRNWMRTRQSRADALAAASEVETEGTLDDVFERWDARVTEREIVAGCDDPSVAAEGSDPSDDLERVLASEEEDAALRAELAALRAEPEPSADASPADAPDPATEPR